MSNDFPDVHHKLCKKAAHLTAAFYYLNLKNDENNLILQTTIQAYEKEMDNIIKIANDMLDKHIKDNPQYKQVKEISAAYQQFKQGIEQERKEAMQEFKDYKKAVEEKEKQRDEDIGVLIQGYEEEIDNIKEKLKALESLFGSQVDGKDLEREKEKGLLENLEAREREIEQLKEKNDELERLNEELKGKNKSLKEIGSANSLESENLMNDLKSQLKNMQKEVESSKKSLKDREEEFEARMKKMKKEHQDNVENISKEHNGNVKKMKDEFEKERKIKDERIASLEEKLKKSEDLLEKLKLESVSKEKEEQLLQEIQRLNNLLEETKKSFNEKLDLQNKRSEETRLRILQESKVDKEKSLQILREELTNEKNVIVVEKDKKIKELEDQLRVFLEGPSAEDLAAEYQNKINALSQRHNNQVRELIEKHDEKTESMTKHYEKELSEVSNAREREKENILKKKDEDRNSEIGNLKKEYEAKLQKISRNFDQKLQEKMHELVMKLNEKEDEVSNLKEEVEYVQEQLREQIEKLEQKEAQCKEHHGSKIHRSSSLKSSQVVEQTKSLFDMMGLNLKDLLRKFKEEDFMDKGKEDIINDHLVFAEKIDKFFTALQRQHEEKIQMMMDQYNELMAAFRSRSSKSEGLSIIRQLQEENIEREEEIKRIGESSKNFLPEMHKRETQSYTKGFTSQTSLGAAANLTLQTEKGKKSQKVLVAPITTTSSSTLPPISVTQSTLNQRSSHLNYGLMQPKKLFK